MVGKLSVEVLLWEVPVMRWFLSSLELFLVYEPMGSVVEQARSLSFPYVRFFTEVQRSTPVPTQTWQMGQ